jgi:hypothetical protein
MGFDGHPFTTRTDEFKIVETVVIAVRSPEISRSFDRGRRNDVSA